MDQNVIRPAARPVTYPSYFRLALSTTRARLLLCGGERIDCVVLRVVIAVNPVADAILHAILDTVCDARHRLNAGSGSGSVARLALPDLTYRRLGRAARLIGVERRLLLLGHKWLFILLIDCRSRRRRSHLRHPGYGKKYDRQAD